MATVTKEWQSGTILIQPLEIQVYDITIGDQILTWSMAQQDAGQDLSVRVWISPTPNGLCPHEAANHVTLTDPGIIFFAGPGSSKKKDQPGDRLVRWELPAGKWCLNVRNMSCQPKLFGIGKTPVVDIPKPKRIGGGVVTASAEKKSDKAVIRKKGGVVTSGK